MARYLDGFLLPIPTKNVAAYRKLAQNAGKVWMEHGALAYREAIGEDLDVEMGRGFPSLTGARKGQSVIFAWILYRSRKHRDAVNEKVMKDPRMDEMMGEALPFDPARMAYGGFELIVDLTK